MPCASRPHAGTLPNAGLGRDGAGVGPLGRQDVDHQLADRRPAARLGARRRGRRRGARSLDICLSATSRLPLGHISAASRLPLGYLSATSRLPLGYLYQVRGFLIERAAVDAKQPGALATPPIPGKLSLRTEITRDHPRSPEITRPSAGKLSLRASITGSILLDGVRVPEATMLPSHYLPRSPYTSPISPPPSPSLP